MFKVNRFQNVAGQLMVGGTPDGQGSLDRKLDLFPPRPSCQELQNVWNQILPPFLEYPNFNFFTHFVTLLQPDSPHAWAKVWPESLSTAWGEVCHLWREDPRGDFSREGFHRLCLLDCPADPMEHCIQHEVANSSELFFIYLFLIFTLEGDICMWHGHRQIWGTKSSCWEAQMKIGSMQKCQAR